MERLQTIIPSVDNSLVVPTQRTNFTKQQIKFIHRRDQHQCQHPIEHEHMGNLQVHHIIAQMYAQVALGLTPEMVNSAGNGILVCENVHVGVDTRIQPPEATLHPDHYQARKDYAINIHAFHEVGMRHRQLALDSIKYWNYTHDDRLMMYAMWATENEMRKYQTVYPGHYGK